VPWSAPVASVRAASSVAPDRAASAAGKASK